MRGFSPESSMSGRRRRPQGVLRRWLAPTLLLVGLLGAWEIAARWGLLADALSLKSYLVPAPSDIASSLWSDRSLLASNAWVTLREVLGGLAIAIVVGFALAVLIHLSATLRRALYPLLVASQTIPIVAIAPILIVWFGFGIGPKLAIIALVCFFPVTVNTFDGLRSVDPELTKLMRTLDAITRGEMQGWLARALADGGRTAVLVTHDVEEALYLSDRVLVLSRRPARVVAELTGPAPRLAPRRDAVTSLAFVEARERALAALARGGA